MNRNDMFSLLYNPKVYKVASKYKKYVEEVSKENTMVTNVKKMWCRLLDIEDKDENIFGNNFYMNMVPRMVAMYGKVSTHMDIYDGKITLEQAKKRSMGNDTAARINHIIVNSSLIFGADPNSKRCGIIAIGPGVIEDGKPSFHAAIELNNYQITRMLANRGGRTDITSSEGSYPIHYAFCNRDVSDDKKLKSEYHRKINEFERFNAQKIRKLILDRTKDVNVIDDEGKTALHYAAENPWVDGTRSIQMLLNRNATVNIQDKDGNTPLHIAAKNGSPDMIEVLVKSNAVLHIRNKQGDTAYMTAIKNNRNDIVEKIDELKKDHFIENTKVRSIKNLKPTFYNNLATNLYSRQKDGRNNLQTRVDPSSSTKQPTFSI